jgi:hypothetical protein
VIELNSETSRRSGQLAYLQTLLRARGTCRLAFWHRPRFSAGLHGDSRDMDPYRRALQGHARLVVSGHDRPGARGESHYPVNHSKPGLAFGDSAHWGALRIDLQRGSARIAFEATSGRMLDSHRVSCQA